VKKLLKYTLGSIGSLVFGYFLVGLVLSLAPTSPKSIDCDEKKEVYISSNGIHLDIVMPIDLVDPGTSEALKIPPSAKYVSFGWGDRGFYLETPTWSDLKFSVAFNAVFLKSESAMHVDYRLNRSERWTKLSLCPEQQHELMDYINQSFKIDENGGFLLIDYPGYNETDSFYEAKGSYNLVMTCNEWVNVGLKRIGVRTSVWSPFEFGVLHHLNQGLRNDRE
jgi:uncharacterized protein (TIGR02117 family)